MEFFPRSVYISLPDFDFYLIYNSFLILLYRSGRYDGIVPHNEPFNTLKKCWYNNFYFLDSIFYKLLF